MNYREEVFNEIERYSSFNQKIILMGIDLNFMNSHYFYMKNITVAILITVLMYLQVRNMSR